jgi:hypothetical protein
MFFGEIFVKNPCSIIIFLLIKRVPETIRSKKKVGVIFQPFLLCTVGSYAFLPPGSGIKHPLTAILMCNGTGTLQETKYDKSNISMPLDKAVRQLLLPVSV